MSDFVTLNTPREILEAAEAAEARATAILEKARGLSRRVLADCARRELALMHQRDKLIAREKVLVSALNKSYQFCCSLLDWSTLGTAGEDPPVEEMREALKEVS